MKRRLDKCLTIFKAKPEDFDKKLKLNKNLQESSSLSSGIRNSKSSPMRLSSYKSSQFFFVQGTMSRKQKEELESLPQNRKVNISKIESGPFLKQHNNNNQIHDGDNERAGSIAKNICFNASVQNDIQYGHIFNKIPKKVK